MTDIDNKNPCFEKNTTISQHKIILSKLSKASFQAEDVNVEIIDRALTGFVHITIDPKELGIPFGMYTTTLGKTLSSLNMVNFIGETVVKANINKILPEVLKIDTIDALVNIDAYSHLSFGVKHDFRFKKVIFIFHISLLPKILTEEFKTSINY